MKKGYYSNREMMYGRPGGDARMLERGEIFDLLATPNDRVMIENNYIVDIAAMEMTIEPHECVRCNKKFVDGSYKHGHDTNDNPCAQAARGEPVEVSSGELVPVGAASMPGEPTEEV